MKTKLPQVLSGGAMSDRGTTLLASVAMFFALGACEPRKPTQIVVSIDSDLAIPEEIDLFVVRTEYRGEEKSYNEYDLAAPGSSAATLPATLTLISGSDPAEPVLITVTGKKGTTRVVERRARITWVPGKILLLRMMLLRSCAHLFCEGDEEQTCIDGRCQSIDVQPAELPEYTAEAAFEPLDAGLGADAPADRGADTAPADDRGIGDARSDRDEQADAGSDGDLIAWPDLGVDAQAPDMATDMPILDAPQPQPDAPPPDAPQPDAPQLPTSDTCASATLLTLSNGKATASGDTSTCTDEFAALACQGTGATSATTMGGPQAYYRFAGTKDQWYRVILAPTFSAYLYLFTTGCAEAEIQSDCQSSGATGETSSAVSAATPEAVYFKTPADGDIIVAVDSTDAQQAGPFELTVEAIAAPTNGTCAEAAPLIFSNGVAEARGDTDAKLTPDEFAAAAPWEGVLCGGTSAFDGPQAYFTFDAAAGTAYNITLAAEAATFLYTYVFASTCTKTDIEAACASAGVSGDVLGSSSSSGASRTFLFMPETPGNFTIAVDSRSPTSAGLFTLTVQEVTPAVNTTCAGALPITLASGKGSVAGSTTLAKNEFGVDITCGLGGSIVGPQVYYELDTQPDKGYRIMLEPDFVSYFYTFQKASCGTATAIDTDCKSGATGNVWGAAFPGTVSTMYFMPATATTYDIAVDSAGNAAVGDFTLEVEEVDLPTNTVCSAPTPITLSNGEATISDTTGFSSDEYAGLTCSSGGDPLDGPQLYYSLAMQTGRFYELRFTPAYYDGYVYVFSGGCSEAAVSADCSSEGATGAVSGPVAFATTPLYFVPPSADAYNIGVDSALSSQYADEFGDFVLEVKERAPAANGTCATAKPLALSGNTATEQGYTVLVPNEFGAAVTCGSSPPLQAGQVYYTVDLSAGTEYLFKLFPDFDARIYLFPEASGGGCLTAAAISGACGSTTGGYAEVAGGNKGGIIFTPAADGTYYLAIDGEGPRDVGGFKLVVNTTPTNQTCAAPQDLALSSSPATVSGDTSLGVSNDLAIDCGNPFGPWPGPQLYYRLSLQQGVAYAITVKQQGWDPALYAFPATTPCTDAAVQVACTNPFPADPENVYNSDGIGIGDETIHIKPAAAGDWIVVVDSFDDQNYPSGRGPFSLEVTW